ncbi:MAG: lysophospholipid acyltransferase family protein [Burkholderiaceae bacterium]
MRLILVWPLLLLHVLVGLLIQLISFWWLPIGARLPIIALWSRILLAICGIRLMRHGNVPATGSMVVMNHVSWIDIFVLMACAPSCFVAKSEIARWPLLGWLVRMAGTEFIDRGKRHAVRATLHRVRDRMLAGESVAVFPEGTTSDGRQLLPFHANLLQAAVEAGRPVTPIALSYFEGARHSLAAAYIGDMNLLQSITRIARARQHVARLDVLPPLPVDGLTRHQLAEQAQGVMLAALVSAGVVQKAE